MNQYLLADQNRETVQGHNENLVVTTTRQVGKASYVSHDFNREEEFRLLDSLLRGEGADALTADTLTVRVITKEMYGTDDDPLTKRVRSSLRYGSPYQKRLTNGMAVVARQDGTLRITRNAEEFGDLVEENAAQDIAKVSKYVRTATVRVNRDLAAAVDKVPELAERISETRKAAKDSLNTHFTRQLELLSGAD